MRRTPPCGRVPAAGASAAGARAWRRAPARRGGGRPLSHSPGRPRAAPPREEGGRPGAPDLRRVALAGAYGFGFVGPVGGAWYAWLERASGAWSRGPGLAKTAGKLTLDTLVFGPFSVAALFVHMGLGEGETPRAVRRKLEEDLLPTFLLDSAFWVPFQCANFALVPPRHHLLAVNLACLADSCLLSWAKHADVARILRGFGGGLLGEAPGQGEPGGEERGPGPGAGRDAG